MSKLLISQYLNELGRLKQVSGTHRESVVREAFKDNIIFEDSTQTVLIKNGVEMLRGKRDLPCVRERKPEVELVPAHVVPEVQQMIRRAEVLRDEQGGQLPLLK